MNPPVDLENLRDMTGGDVELERELFQVFLESSAECLAALRANSHADAGEEWRRQAHMLKGISINLGAEKLGQLCRQAQDGHTAGESHKTRMFAAIEEEYHRVRSYLESIQI